MESEAVSEDSARPFLKWAGGKGRLISELLGRLPARFGRYHEPFMGGAALFFELCPGSAVLSDLNPELVNAYTVVRDSVEELIADLARHRYEEEYFYAIRELDREETFAELSPVARASRLIYLNRTCFNGLYRVNSRGHFNVPFGKYDNPRIVDAPNLRACSAALAGVDLLCSKYLEVESRAEAGDLIYFDPPYAPLSPTSNFTSYSSSGFRDEDQAMLRDLCARLDKRGVHFMLSNSSAPLVLDLYRGFNLQFIDAARAINSKGSGRGKVREVIVTNY